MFHLCRNQVVGFYELNVWKTPVEEWHSASKNQLPGSSVNGTLVENGLIKFSRTNWNTLKCLQCRICVSCFVVTIEWQLTMYKKLFFYYGFLQ